MEDLENNPNNEEQQQHNYGAPYRIKKLKRSEHNRIAYGVCGGMGEYLSIDPVFFRMIFLFGILLGGWGIVIYLIFALVLPKENEDKEIDQAENERIRQQNIVTLFAGFLLIAGVYIILDNMGYFRFLSLLGVPKGLIITLIIGTLLFLSISIKRGTTEEFKQPEKFLRGGEDALFGGVCSGFASYIGARAGAVRAAFILLSVFAMGIPLLIYIYFMVRVPKENGVEL